MTISKLWLLKGGFYFDDRTPGSVLHIKNFVGWILEEPNNRIN